MRKLSETQIKNEIDKLDEQIKELEAKKYYLQTAIDYKEDVYDKADFVEDCNNKIKDRMLELGLAGAHDVRVDLDLAEGLHKSKEFAYLDLYIDETQICRSPGFINNLSNVCKEVLLKDLELIMLIHESGLNLSELSWHDKSIRVYEDLFIYIKHNDLTPIDKVGEYSINASKRIASINDDNEVDGSYKYLQDETRQIDFNMSKSYVKLNEIPEVIEQFIAADKDALDCVDLKVKK